ncbi:MAG: hypothetical protein Q9183_004330 [Haloplaca sp. 2 TL-2023]
MIQRRSYANPATKSIADEKIEEITEISNTPEVRHRIRRNRQEIRVRRRRPRRRKRRV